MITIEELKQFQEMELKEAKHQIMIEMEELLEFQRRAVEALQQTHQIKLESLKLRFEEELHKIRESSHSVQVNGRCQRTRPWESKSNGNQEESQRTIKIITPEKILGLSRSLKAKSTRQQHMVPSITLEDKTTSNLIVSRTSTGKPQAPTNSESTINIIRNAKRSLSLVEKEQTSSNGLMGSEHENDDKMENQSKKSMVKSSVVIANEMRSSYLQKKRELVKKMKSTNKIHELKQFKAKDQKVIEKSVFCAKDNKIVEKEIIVSNNGNMFLISNKD